MPAAATRTTALLSASDSIYKNNQNPGGIKQTELE